jgi:hypothetical protein
LQGTQLNGNIIFTTKLNNISPTVFGYLGNVTSDIQSQLGTCVKTWTVVNTTTNTLATGSSTNVSISSNVASTTQNLNMTLHSIFLKVTKEILVLKGPKDRKEIQVQKVIQSLKDLPENMVLHWMQVILLVYWVLGWMQHS